MDLLRVILGLLIAVISAVLRRFDVKSHYIVFPGFVYNLGRLLTKRTPVAIGAAAICALLLFKLPFSLDGVAQWFTFFMGVAYTAFECVLVVTAVHRWSAIAASRVHSQPDARIWSVGILVVASTQVVFSLYLLFVRVENSVLALACGLLSLAVIGHNVIAENGVIVAASSCVFAAVVFLTIGTSTSLFAGVISGQLVTPLLIGVMGAGNKQEYSFMLLLLSVYMRTEYRIYQSFICLVGSPTMLLFFDKD
jgi:hypothetical protein